jgi:hypothetical protein
MDLLAPIQEMDKSELPRIESHFVQSDIDSQNVIKVIQSKSDIAKREIELYLDLKIQNQSLMISEKFKKLEIVLEGKEALKKLQTK